MPWICLALGYLAVGFVFAEGLRWLHMVDDSDSCHADRGAWVRSWLAWPFYAACLSWVFVAVTLDIYRHKNEERGDAE